MADRENGQQDSGKPRGLSLVFRGMEDAYRTDVVKRALDWRSLASSGARAALADAINAHVEVAGFRKGKVDIAPAPRLLGPVTDNASAVDAIAKGILRVWAESHGPLRDTVVAFMEEESLLDDGGDYPKETVIAFPPGSRWDESVNKLIERHSDFSKDDLRLMSCCVSGRVRETGEEWEPLGDAETPPRTAAHDEIGTGIAGMLSEISEPLLSLPRADSFDQSLERLIDQFLDGLRARCPDHMGEELQSLDFTDAVKEVQKAKFIEQALANGLAAALSNIRNEHSALLDFFEQDRDRLAALIPGPDNSDNSLDEVAERLRAFLEEHTRLRLRRLARYMLEVDSLSRKLNEYRPIHGQAGTFKEEQLRSSRRAEMQEAIDRDFRQLADLISATAPVEPPEVEESVEAPIAQIQEDTSLDSHIAAPGAIPETLPISCSIDHHLHLLEEVRDLRDLNRDLEQENDDLEETCKRLRQQLYDAQNKEAGLRLALANQSDPEVPPAEAAEVASVEEAVRLAQASFAHRLVIAANSESNVEDSQFKWPDKVMNALEWLATTYYDSRSGQLTVTDLDASCREHCDMWYKATQGETTMTAYPNSYTTVVDGEQIWLEEHIGKGNSFDPRRTIRIAFNWDKTRQQVIVGYIGRHQRTRAS